MLEIKQDKALKQKVAGLIKRELKASKLRVNRKTDNLLLDEFTMGVIQDSISAHLMANIIKQKVQMTPGTVLLNPEDTSTQKNTSIKSIKSVITKNLNQFCKMWQPIANPRIKRSATSAIANTKIKRSTMSAIDILNTYIIPAIKERLILIINIADEILTIDGISNGYAKIYGHIYKNTPNKDKTKDAIVDELATDLASIFVTYYYETKKPQKFVPWDLLHMFHFSWMRDIYLPKVQLRKASTLFKENAESTNTVNAL
jgi:hypothetical protein